MKSGVSNAVPEVVCVSSVYCHYYVSAFCSLMGQVEKMLLAV
jgi:hypothetical protein